MPQTDTTINYNCTKTYLRRLTVATKITIDHYPPGVQLPLRDFSGPISLDSQGPPAFDCTWSSRGKSVSRVVYDVIMTS